MRISVVDRIERGDALSRPRTGPGDAERYSEWHHFNFNDDANGLYGIFNLALSGDVGDPEKGRAGVSLVVSEQGRWRGTMNMHPVEDARYEPGAVDLALGDCSVRLRDGRYRIAGALKDGSVVLDAVCTPACEGVRVDNIGGLVSTFILPRLDVEGTLSVAGRDYRFDGATGYHDHNWGYWTWGSDLGWDWGYIIEAPAGVPEEGRARPVSLVFGQVTDATRARAKSDLVLVVWVGDRCTQVFLDDAVEIAAGGELARNAVPRVPGVLALLDGHHRPVPDHLEIRARDGDEWLEMALDVDHAMQFLIPHAGGRGTTTVSELVGRYSVRGVLDGEKLDFSYVGFAELAG